MDNPDNIGKFRTSTLKWRDKATSITRIVDGYHLNDVFPISTFKIVVKMIYITNR